MSDTPQSKGGAKRAEALSPEARSEIARQGAVARWHRPAAPVDPNALPEAEYQGELTIGDTTFDCYNLKDGRRVIHKRGMAKALGLKSEGGNAFMKMITRQSIGSALTEELREKINDPIVFKPLFGDPGHGYGHDVLIEVCEALVDAGRAGKLVSSQLFLAIQAELIIRASARVGLAALIDEATGYVADKRKKEYQDLFNAFIRQECRQWEQEFPDQFFNMLYRIYGLKRKNPKSMKHPTFFALVIRKYIYKPLANSNGAILEQLEGKNPVVYTGGGRRHKLHQFLTDQVGLPAFRQHLWQIIGIGNSVADKAAFERAFERAFPQALDPDDMFFGQNLQ